MFGVRLWNNWKVRVPVKSFAAFVGSVYETPRVQNGPWAIDAAISGLLEVTV